MFYTGYSINFDDLLPLTASGHYFATRWSAYYPMYVAQVLLGPTLGRLAVRLGLAVFMLHLLWRLGDRWAWSRAQRYLLAMLLVTMPMFARAFLTDYVEYIVVSLGTCLVLLCLHESRSLSSGLIFGVLAAFLMVANPLAVFLVALCVLCAVFLGPESVTQKVRFLALGAAGAITTAAAGYALFRWRYDVPNIYAPTINYVQSHTSDSGLNQWKSPNTRWLLRDTWLYAPPLLVTGALTLRFRTRIPWTASEKAAAALCMAQYAIQWYDQFARGGYGLEMSFYWSFQYPAFGVAVVVLVAKFTMRSSRTVTFGVAVTWLILLAVGIPRGVRLPASVNIFVLVLATLVSASLIARRSTGVAIGFVLLGLLLTQIAPPHELQVERTTSSIIDSSPRYDVLFRQTQSGGQPVLEEAIWFARMMDTVAGDERASFLPLGRFAGSIVAIYAPQVTGRLVEADASTGALNDQALADFRGGKRPILAVIGPDSDVARMLGVIHQGLSGSPSNVLLDVTHGSALRYRLTVLELPDATKLPFRYPASALNLARGERHNDEVAVGTPDSPGIVTFGPYLSLDPGQYNARLTYRSTEDAQSQVGTFDVSTISAGIIRQESLIGTTSASGIMSIDFVVDQTTQLWEFRTSWLGIGTLNIVDIVISRV
jgi:hypothetical protein